MSSADFVNGLLSAVSLGREFGWVSAVSLQLGVLTLLWISARAWARGKDQRPRWTGLDWRRLLSGPWPLLFSAGLLAVLNWVTLLIAGHPWTITWAFTLWGAKTAAALGWDPATSAFWTSGFQEAPWRKAFSKT